MTPPIVDWVTAPSLPELDSDTARLIATANCVDGIRRWCLETYGAHPDAGMVAWARDNWKQAKRGVLDDQCVRLLRLAWQSELTGRVSLFTGSTDVMRMSAHMLPVQAYYAVYNGLRVLLRLRTDDSDKHAQVQRTFAKNIARRVPSPWNAILEGQHDDRMTQVTCPSTLPVPATSINPVTSSCEPAEYVYAALKMARRWQYEKQCEAVLATAKTKRGTPRKNLNAELRQRAWDRTWPTTLLDFLYGLRVRSNYKQSDEYNSEASDHHFRDFHVGLTHMVHTGLLVVEAEVANRLGADTYRQQAETWCSSIARAGDWAAEPVEQRCEAILNYGAW